jgi:hypothetical protein
MKHFQELAVEDVQIIQIYVMIVTDALAGSRKSYQAAALPSPERRF